MGKHFIDDFFDFTPVSFSISIYLFYYYFFFNILSRTVINNILFFISFALIVNSFSTTKREWSARRRTTAYGEQALPGTRNDLICTINNTGVTRGAYFVGQDLCGFRPRSFGLTKRDSLCARRLRANMTRFISAYTPYDATTVRLVCGATITCCVPVCVHIIYIYMFMGIKHLPGIDCTK